MSDQGSNDPAGWGDVVQESKQKRAIPAWMGFCGCGCLVIVLALVAMTWMGVNWVQEGQDAELQWESLEEVLPYGERIEGYDLMFGQDFFFLSFHLYLFQQQMLEANNVH